MVHEIQIEELRIGNLVKCRVSNDAGIYKITHLDGYMLTAHLNGARVGYPYPLTKLKPIPLDETWLERCGLEKGDPDLPFYNDPWLILPIPKSDLILSWEEERHLRVSHFDGLEIKYVHTLQNLYYALCGQELEIKQDQ